MVCFHYTNASICRKYWNVGLTWNGLKYPAHELWCSNCFHIRNYIIYSHGVNVSFSKYFYQHFLGDKWYKSLKWQETQETRKILRQNKPHFFLNIEIEIKSSIKSTRLKPRVTAEDLKTMQILENWLCWNLRDNFDWVSREDWDLINNR